MTLLFIIIGITVLLVIGGTILLKRFLQENKINHLLIPLAAIGSIACHYFSLIYCAFGYAKKA